MNKQSFIYFLSSLPIYFVFSGIFLYDNSAKNLQAIIILSSIVSIVHFGLNNIKQNIVDNKLLWIMLSFVIYGIAQNYTHGFSNGIIKTYACLIIYFSITPSFVIHKIKDNLENLCFIASICSMMYLIQQDVISENKREFWSIGVLHYSIMSAWLCCFSLYNIVTNHHLTSIAKSVFIFSSSLLLIISTQSRTTFIALIVIILLFMALFILKSKKGFVLSILSIMLLTGVLSQSSDFNERVKQTTQEINLIENGNLNSSFGQRIQMWLSARYIFKQSPIFGVGDEHLSIKKELASNQKISSKIISFRHYHNGFIDPLVKSGIIGLILNLLVLLYPLAFWLRSKCIENFPCLALSLLYIIASLTNVPLNNLHLIFFFLTISWIYTQKKESIT